ncbi:MAG: FeoA family protein [Rubrivivax sp.]
MHSRCEWFMGVGRGSTAQQAGQAGTPVDRLHDAPTGQPLRIVAVHSPEQLPDWGRWLAEIGFLPGEPVAVTARSVWGGDPLVVRVGSSTFALRRAEAACVQVQAL